VFKLEKDLGLSLESQKIELSDHHILNNVDMCAESDLSHWQHKSSCLKSFTIQRKHKKLDSLVDTNGLRYVYWL
jgi:hypothetical protein